MQNVVGRNWVAVLLRGIAALLFGIAALVWPGITLIVLVFLFGAFALVSGILAIISALGSIQSSERWALVLIQGIVGVLVGIAVFVWPGITGLILLYVIALWAIATGILEIIYGFGAGGQPGQEWGLIVTGIVSVLFGLLLLFFPGAGALGVIIFIGAYAIIAGILLIIAAFQIRSRPAPMV